MKMRLKPGQKLFLSIFVIAFCMAIPILFSYVFAAGTETWYTDFELTSPSSVSTSSGETTGSFTWSLTNHDEDTIDIELHFVDAVPLHGAYYACKADNQTEVFGQYLQMDGNNYFSVQPGDTITGTINFEFPSYYSGTYYGCIVYSVDNDLGNPSGNNKVTDMTSRKAIPVQVTLQASKVSVRIVANLGSRGNENTLNLNGYESKGKLLFYPPNHNPEDLPIESGYVIMNHEGFGELTGVKVLAGTYDVVYKGWQHLASYITNVTINEGDVLDFVLNATGVGEVEHRAELKYNSGWTYQIAGDMPTANNDYDNVINTNDLSVLFARDKCPYLQFVEKGHVCDLNNDGRVDSSDATAILKNLDVKDVVYYDGVFTGFGYVYYFDHPYYNQ